MSADERKTFAVVVMLLARGATPPWPATMVSLLDSLNERSARAFGAILAQVDPQRTKPTFPPGAQVIVWAQDKMLWEEGIVRGAKVWPAGSPPLRRGHG